MTKVVLTEKEQIVWDALKNIIDTEDVYCVHVTGIADEVNMPVNVVKGVIGSLVKKYLVGEVEDNEFEAYDWD